MRKQSTLGVCMLMACMISLHPSIIKASECPTVISGTVNSVSNPLSVCSAYSEIRITGTLVIQSDYDISSFSNSLSIIVDGGLIRWQSAKDFNLPVGAKLKLINGGQISGGNGCNKNRTLSFGGVKVASCNGEDANLSFAEINGAGSVDMGGLLPVELSHFSGKESTEGVQLEWETASETENDHFEIEHSRDGRVFKEVGKMKGAGTSNLASYYEYLHESPGKGIHYYRLKQVDFDGTFSYSPVISVVVESDHEWKDTFSVFPNPAREVLFVQLDSPEENVIVVLYSALGQKWLLEYKETGLGMNVSLPASLTPGTYYLQLQLNNQQLTQPVVLY